MFEDIDILKEVQKVSNEIIIDDPLLEKEKNKEFKKLVEKNFNGRIEI